jgi:hypothetical protein
MHSKHYSSSHKISCSSPWPVQLYWNMRPFDYCDRPFKNVAFVGFIRQIFHVFVGVEVVFLCAINFCSSA